MSFRRHIASHFPAVRAWGLCAIVAGSCLQSRAGWIEELPDRTVLHVKVFHLPTAADTSTANRAEVAAIRLFKERFPEIFEAKYRERYQADPDRYGTYNWDRVEVRLHRATGIRVEGVENDLLMIAGDQAPDVLHVDFRKSSSYIENGFLYPLDKPEDGYLAGPGALTPDEIAFRIHDKLWPVIRRPGPDGTENVWAMPYGGARGKVLLYRKDLFDEHDIPYPDNQWTWEKLHSACRKLTNPSRDVYGLWSARGKQESWYWMTYLWSAGGKDMVFDAETGEWRCAFDSREAAVALDFYLHLVAEQWHDEAGGPQRGYTTRDVSQTSEIRWVEGRIGMFITFINERLFSRINPDVTGMAPVPLGYPDETGFRHRGGELNSSMMGLFSEIDHPAIRDAAWEYIRFSDDKEALALKTRIMVEGGFGRFMNPRYLEMFGYEDFIRLSPPGWVDTYRIAIESGRPEPYGHGSSLAYTLMTYPIQEAEQRFVDGELSGDRETRLVELQEILGKWNERANEKMIGVISESEMRKRRITAWLALGVIIVAFVAVFRKVFQTFRPPDSSGREEKAALAWGFRKYRLAYLILLPAVLTVFVWQYLPLARGTVMAFQDYNILGESKWVWVDNFANLLWDFDENGWWDSVWNSARYSFLVVGLTFLPPIILAILLQELPVGTVFFRTIYYLPAVITGLVTMLLWKMFYAPTEFGVLNQVIMSIPSIVYVAIGLVMLWIGLVFAGRLWFHESRFPALLAAGAGVLLCYTSVRLAGDILFPGGEPFVDTIGKFFGRLFQSQDEPYRWLSDRNTAMLACIIPMVWAGVGPGCLIYLAALRGIADDYYEASDIDGATFIDKIMFVIFPILRPLIIINFIGVFIGSWQQAENILAMTGGAAGTEVANLKIFYEAYTFLNMGPATAMAWVLATMLIGFTVYQLRILARLEFRTTG